MAYYRMPWYSSKERRGVETSHRSQDLEQFCHSPTFQDGETPDVEGSVGTKSLDGKSQLKGCTVPIHHSHTGYLKFLWKGKAYKFVCLPFGLASAPRTFTKILKPVANFLGSHGVKMLVYIDDILVTADTKESLRQQLHLVSSTLTALGFALNTKKCILEPTQQI